MSSDTITLNGVCDSEAAVLLHKVLLDRLYTKAEVVLEGADVERMTTPVAQVLLAAQRSFYQAGVEFHFGTLSEACQKALSDLGLGLQSKHWSH